MNFTVSDLQRIFSSQLNGYAKELNFALVIDGKQDFYNHPVNQLESLCKKLQGFKQISNQHGYDIKTDLKTRPRFEK